MTSNAIIMFLALLPIAFLGQLARSWRLPRPQRHLGADLLEAAGLALGMSLGLEGSALFPQWHPSVSFVLLFAGIYFSACFFSDWIRKRPRHDA